MSSSTNLIWLARDQEVHGPYDQAQLIEMDAHEELLPTDHFQIEATEYWMNYDEWRGSLRKRTVIKASQRVLSHTERLLIDQRRRSLESLGRVQSRPTVSKARLAQTPPVDETPERRLERITDIVSDHRREYCHDHPFHFADDQQIAEVIAWLDYYHPLWDYRLTESLNYRADLLDKWLIPAIAKVHPDLIKEGYGKEFERGRRWYME